MTRTGPAILLLILIALTGLCWCGPALAAADAAAPKPTEKEVVWIAPDQEAAKKRAAEMVPFVEAVMDECKLCRQQRLRDMGLGVKDQTESYYLLDSPIIRKTEDHYGPVRFMHAKHAQLLDTIQQEKILTDDTRASLDAAIEAFNQAFGA
jgi:hypothetical protein